MGKRALAVDDSATMRKMVSYTLKSAGFEVKEASDGADALKVLNENSPVDLIITDLNMPGMDGLELISNLRGTPGYERTPILVLTTESDQAKKDRGRASGATGWIVKPFNPDTLLQIVTKVCP